MHEVLLILTMCCTPPLAQHNVHYMSTMLELSVCGYEAVHVPSCTLGVCMLRVFALLPPGLCSRQAQQGAQWLATSQGLCFVASHLPTAKQPACPK